MTAPPQAAARRCDRCRTQPAPVLRRCPGCGGLVHAERLRTLAWEADDAERRGDARAALSHWSTALELLPPDAPQVATIQGHAERLRERLDGDARDGRDRASGRRGLWVGLGAAALFVATKGKFLLLGLSKAGTLLSMLAFLGLYWSLYGWLFALGLVLSIYVHEMGHVAAIRHYGLPAGAPMFVPGLGAFIRLKARPPTPGVDARIGLAGPLWGLWAALAAWGLYRLTGNGLYAGVAHVGAVLNLFNLVPVWQLDGGRGLRPLARAERLVLLAVTAAAFLVFREPMLLLVGLCLGIHCVAAAPGEGDRGALVQFGFLVLALALVATVRGAVPGAP